MVGLAGAPFERSKSRNPKLRRICLPYSTGWRRRSAVKHLKRCRRSSAQHADIAHDRKKAHAAFGERSGAFGGVAKYAGNFSGGVRRLDHAIDLALDLG